MKLNLSSLSFNMNLESGGGTPAWGTELGQNSEYKFSDGLQDFLTAMLYKSVSQIDEVSCPLGKGGNQKGDYDFLVASIFDKVFVNGEKVEGARILLLIVRKIAGENHVGRMTLKYSPKMEYLGEPINANGYRLIASKLGVDFDKAAWFVDRLDTKNQDELHLTAYVGSSDELKFKGTDERKAFYLEKIKELGPKTRRLETSESSLSSVSSLQVIYYGAPGTGKSYKIKNLEKGQGTKPVRTTFHPDSDYATFVGSYKPTMIDNNDGRPNRSYSIDELAELLKVAYQSSVRKTLSVHSFVLTYAEQINGIYGRISIKDLIEKSGLPDGYQAMINDALNLYHYYIKQQSKDTKIAYKFVPQAFLKAYTQAWEHYPEPQYLVIEEINRGNCAQIFGDLFQLLDRNSEGFSEYPIAADSDISKYLSETFDTDDKFAPDESARAEINALYKEEYTDVMADVRSGELLLLPKNLHILATMNTSDQSLFPIDSAFKRRWEWEYVPIRNAQKGWVIEAAGKTWDWWTFLKQINSKIGSVTDSEDKKLGYFFVKPQDNQTISADTFVSKVIFYLWNDVFKDYGFSDKEFQTATGGQMTFPMFYETEVQGQRVNEELVAQFLDNVIKGDDTIEEADSQA